MRVYRRVHIMYVSMYVCACSHIYLCGSSPWGWRVLNCHFCKVALWHLLPHTIHVCACMCMGACMHLNKMLYYIMITKFTVTECNSHFFLLMYLIKITHWYKTKSVLTSGWLTWLCSDGLHASDLGEGLLSYICFFFFMIFLQVELCFLLFILIYSVMY